MTRRPLLAAIVLMGMLPGALPGTVPAERVANGSSDHADTPSGAERERVKALEGATLWKMLKFVTWPDDHPGRSGAPIVFGIVGMGADGSRDPFERAIRQLALQPDGTSTARAVRVAMPASDAEPALLARARDELRRCHVVFVHDEARDDAPRVLAMLQSAPVLTVSDLDGFARKGGMIQMFLRDGKVALIMNKGETEAVGLRIPPQLYARAAEVIARGR